MSPSSIRSGYRFGLIVLLLVSLVLRLVLVSRGGQYFWDDEGRYGAAAAALDYWKAGDKRAAVLQVIGSADHLGFKVLMLGPAWLQKHVNSDIRTPSYIVSLFSLANIFCVWLIARRTGAGEREAFWAAAAMACANSMFYWARHLMPYDVALFLALACAYVAWKPRPRIWDSLLTGVLGFAAFVTYNGCWALVACILTSHVLRGWPDVWAMTKRSAFGLLGLAGSFYLLLEADLRLDVYLLRSYMDFANTITQGNFNEGHVVFFDYLWQAERFTALIWLGALLAFFWLARKRPADERRRGALWVAMIAALAAILIGGSDIFGKFVVYGRLVRQVVPFCALLVGWTAARLLESRPAWRAAERVALLVLFACAAWSMAKPLRQQFPNAFGYHARLYRDRYESEIIAAGKAPIPADRFRILYDGFIWPYPDEKPLPAGTKVLLASPHPLAWRPYLYEGFNRDQRNRIEATDITMRLVLLKD
jgi:hypothetical protein